MLDGVGGVDGLGTEVSWYTSDGSEHGQGAPPQKIVSERFSFTRSYSRRFIFPPLWDHIECIW